MSVYDYIDDYKAGLLTGEKLQAFEQALQTDEKLRHLVDEYDDIKSLSEGLMELQLLNEVEKISGTTNDNREKSSAPRSWLWLIGLVILAGLLWQFLGRTKQIPKEEQQLQFADVYREPIWPVTKSASQTLDDKYYIEKAASLFLSDDLVSAKKILLDSVQDIPLGHYWLAEMYLNRQQFDSVSHYLPKSTNLASKEERILQIKNWLDKEKN